MKIQIEIDEKVLRSLVLDYLRNQLGSVPVLEKDVQIQVKTTQNYRAEWELGEFRAVVNKVVS